jgi:hypothetical protein
MLAMQDSVLFIVRDGDIVIFKKKIPRPVMQMSIPEQGPVEIEYNAVKRHIMMIIYP